MHAALRYQTPATRKGVKHYQHNEILNASPTELILKLYDLAIFSIRKGNFEKANRVLTELISALNFDYREIALGFFRLYRYCQDQLYQGNSKMALMILQELRDAWAKAFHLT